MADTLVQVKRFAMLPEAELAVATLKEHGIPAVLQKDGPAGMWALVEGADVFVMENDVDRAKEILG